MKLFSLFKSSNVRKVIAALLLASFAIGGAAYALQVDQTRIFNRRFDSNGNHPSYYRVTINWNDQNIGSGQQFGALGLNEFIKSVDCAVITAFNAASTNTVTFGTTAASANEIVASGITAGTVGNYHLTTAVGLGVTATSAAAVGLFAKYAQTGPAATAGQVTCVLDFVPNNDM